MNQSNPTQDTAPADRGCPSWCRHDHRRGSFHRTSFGSVMDGPKAYLTQWPDENPRVSVLRSAGSDLNDLTLTQATILAELMGSRDTRLAGLLRQAVDAAYDDEAVAL